MDEYKDRVFNIKHINTFNWKDLVGQKLKVVVVADPNNEKGLVALADHSPNSDGNIYIVDEFSTVKPKVKTGDSMPMWESLSTL